MDERLPVPGHDEIVLSTPSGGCLCGSREHARLGYPAVVVVTFGELGIRWQRDALWQSSWGRSFPVCLRCWDAMREVAQAQRPGLVVRDCREPAPPPAAASPAGVS
jgi:hypothetical protein